MTAQRPQSRRSSINGATTILIVLRSKPLTTKQVAKRTGRKSVWTALRRLEHKGLVKKSARGHQTYWSLAKTKK